jgi:hypothetical protein
MLRGVACILFGAWLACLPATAATGHVLKVLPTFLDLEGRIALSPSLYERDAYQAYLRQHPELRSGMRFDIEWKTHGAVYAPLKLRLEMRGTAKGDLPSKELIETAVKPAGWFNRWTTVRITGAQYSRIGEVTSWRVTLWEGDQFLGEQQSFLW